MYQNKFILRLHKTISNGKVKIKSIRTIKLTVYQNSFQNILEYDNVKKNVFYFAKIGIICIEIKDHILTAEVKPTNTIMSQIDEIYHLNL